jgi:hypothetical protein
MLIAPFASDHAPRASVKVWRRLTPAKTKKRSSVLTGMP